MWPNDGGGRARDPASTQAVVANTTIATSPHHEATGNADSSDTGRRVGSATTVRWGDFHLEWAQPYLDAAGDWPMAGTQAWFDLPDTDARKWAAVVSAASHHVLRVETAQEAQRDASHAVSAAADWTAIGQHIRSRNEFYACRPWLKRVSA